MTKQLVAIVLDSPQVGLKEFVEAVGYFRELIDALSREHGKGAEVEWVLQSLDVGSAMAVVRGVPKQEENLGDVENIVNAYENASRLIVQRQFSDLPDRVARPARKLAGVVNGKIRALRLETESDEVEVIPVGTVTPPEPRRRSTFGSVKGRIQTLTNRQGLRFTLYDLSADRPISCYLIEGSEEKMRGAWGHLAIVEGDVRRNQLTGKIQTIRNVRSIEVVPEGSPGDFRHARGAIAFDGEAAEAVIRRIRDN